MSESAWERDYAISHLCDPAATFTCSQDSRQGSVAMVAHGTCPPALQKLGAGKLLILKFLVTIMLL